MTKEEILNGMSEEEFYQLYPTKESWEQATQMKLGGLSGAPHNGQPTAAQFFNYGSHALDKFNIPFGHFAFGGGPIYPAKMGGPCYECGGPHMEDGGGLSRGDDYGSKKKPYPSVKSSDFAGGGRSYPIPTRADAVDALRLAGLHGRADVKAKVYAKYPDLKKAEYGFNSGVNYGSFSVPMQAGGDPTALWLAGEQMALMNKTKTPIPTGVKPTGTNPLNYTPFLEGSDIAQPDSMHTSPFNPNIAAYFKGDKMIAGPATNTGQAKRDAMMINRGKMYKKDNVVYPNYLQQEGGAFDQSNAGTYPVLDFGGLNDIISAAAKHMKKAYGGDLTEQGGNQDFKKQYRATFDNYIKQNTYNAIVDAEQQAMMDELQQIPYAQAGKEVGHEGYMVDVPNGYYSNADVAKIKSMKSSNMICTAAGCFPNPHPGHVEPTTNYNNNTAQREAMANQIAQKQGQQQGFFGNFADMYAPTVGQNQMSVFGSLFPANFTRGYEFSNKDYARLKEMGDQGQITGITEKYGPLARLLGKAGRRMFGPKSVTFGVMGPGSASEQQAQPVENVGKGAYDNPSEGMESGQLFKDYNTGVTPVGKQRADFMPSNLWKQAKTQAGPEVDPWTELMNKPENNAGPRAFQDGGNPMAYNEFTLNRKYSGQEDLWKYAPGVFNTFAAGIEQRHDRPEMKAAQLAMMTPGSDVGPFQSVPATGRRMGDYDPNSGMFRPNQMVPVQFQGNLYGYSQMGGSLEEGEETELSPEEIAELRAQGYEIEELD